MVPRTCSGVSALMHGGSLERRRLKFVSHWPMPCGKVLVALLKLTVAEELDAKSGFGVLPIPVSGECEIPKPPRTTTFRCSTSHVGVQANPNRGSHPFLSTGNR